MSIQSQVHNRPLCRKPKSSWGLKAHRGSFWGNGQNVLNILKGHAEENCTALLFSTRLRQHHRLPRPKRFVGGQDDFQAVDGILDMGGEIPIFLDSLEQELLF